ncbi:MAG: hypothetical protein CMJ42_20875 [Phyllobacteriaceae bacterium]|uniref:DUF2798 domain-containing protein n=1 Tax=Zhengella sedimenti TaxID=3390035 RepID=UPI000C687F1A|nr:hypothetical protein [Phyllobacteriaceae bacterium]MBA90789.1 hypothetical protein [Phyllobacteriaceae bacterium]
MKPFLPRRFEGLVFGLLLTGMMSCLVSGLSVFLARGAAPGFAGLWLAAWLPSWALAFPVVLFVNPLVRRIVGTIVKPQ